MTSTPKERVRLIQQVQRHQSKGIQETARAQQLVSLVTHVVHKCVGAQHAGVSMNESLWETLHELWNQTCLKISTTFTLLHGKFCTWQSHRGAARSEREERVCSSPAHLQPMGASAAYSKELPGTGTQTVEKVLEVMG